MAVNQSKFVNNLESVYHGEGAKSAAKDIEKIGHHAEKSEINMRQLHTALSKLGAAPGEIGELLHLVEGGILVGGIAAIGIALDKLNEKFGETAEKARKAAESSLELKQRFEETGLHAALEAAAAVQKFNDTLADSARKQDFASEAMTRILDLTKQQTEQINSLAEATLKLTEAQIAQAVQRGDLTQGQATEETRKAERQARAARDAADDAEKQSQINARIARGTIAQGEISKDQASLAGLRSLSEHQAAASGAQQAEIKSRQDELEAAKKAVADAAAFANDRAKLTEFAVAHGGLVNPNAGMRAAHQEAKERQEDAAQRLETAKADLVTAEQHSAALKNDLDSTNRHVAQLENEIIARNELVQKLSQEAGEIEEDLKLRKANRAKVEALNDRTEAVADRTARESRINSGNASPDDTAVQAGYALASSGAARSGVRDMESRIGLILRNARAGDSAAIAEWRAFGERIVGLLEALHEQIQTGSVKDLERRLNALQSQTSSGFQQ